MVRVWTCQRVKGGKKCGHVNPRRLQLCRACGKRRPQTKQPAHMAVLSEDYESWVDLFGERCGICGRKPTKTRRLDRDHDHTTGAKRGLLCARCNRALPSWTDSKWLRAAADYLDRATGFNSDL